MQISKPTISATSLKTESIKNPLGILPEKPRFSWEVASVQRSQVQTAYEITVYDENKKNIWSTGKVVSNKTLIVYDGKKLKVRTQYTWKVRLWDRFDHVSKWSETATFETGVREDDWADAKWIGSAKAENKTVANAPYLRHSFSTNTEVQRARVYITGLGYYELFINGRRVGKNVINPLVTRYHKRYFYNIYDVTKLLSSGINAIGVMLGRGNYATVDNGTDWQLGELANSPWTGNPKLRMKIYIEYTDGSQEEIVTDESWKTDLSPVIFDMPYYGEAYDARLEQDGWNQATFDDTAWENAVAVTAPAGIPEPQMAEPNMVVEVICPVAVTEPKKGVYVFDMGRIVTGWAELTVKGDVGTRIKIQYAEKLGSDGDIARVTFLADWMVDGELRQPQTDYYTLKGFQNEIWESKFTYKGFRYIQVTGYPGIPTFNSIKGKVVNAALEKIGDFQCSNVTFNYIHEICCNTLLNNLHSYPSDTPVYENLGYLGDGHLTQEMGMYNFDMIKYYEKWMNDIRDQVWHNGFVGHTAPAPCDSMRNAPEWSAAVCIVPWQHYQMSGDKKILLDNYRTMKKVFAYQRSLMVDDIATSCFGDHGTPNRNHRIMMISATSYVYHMSKILENVAKILRQESDVDFYTSECKIINAAFQKRFYHEKLQYYCEDETNEFVQSAQILPLAFGMVPKKLQPHIYELLSQKITAIDTGIFGTKYIFSKLTEAGYGNLAYQLANSHAFPSYGYCIDKGATSLWEGWGEYARSFDHHMLATIDDWFYKIIGGIQADDAGFSSVVIRPYLVGELTFVKAKIRTVRGMIAVSCARDTGGHYTLDVTIPANVTATVYIPALKADSVTEGGILASRAMGVTFICMDKNCAVYTVGSGIYSFKSVFSVPS